MGYNLLVFASSSKRCAFVPFVFGLLRVWTAAGRLFGIHQIPGWIQSISRIFLRSDAPRHQLGTFVGIFFSTSWWDYQVGRYGKTLSTTLRISLVLLSKVDTGYPLSPWLDNDKGGPAASVIPLRLPYCIARDEESKKTKKLLCFRNHACGGVLREGSVISVFANGGLF
jgi:hypothetical protein